MSVLITSPMAAVQSSARELLGELESKQTVMAGLARRVLVSGSVDGIAVDIIAPDDIERNELRRSPALAAIGFEINRCKPSLRSLWMSGVERLRGREAFPGDGQSFVHNPGELLGLLSGLETLDDESADHREWFHLLMRRGLNDGKFRTPISRLAARICLDVLNEDGSEEGIEESELRLITQSSDLLLAAAMIIAFCPAWSEQLVAIENAFTDRVLTETISLTNSGEAAAALILTQRIRDRLEINAGSQLATHDTIVALCRRFPLFAKQIKVRHGGRTTIEIQDEYDVQDLFHAILRLHFDDVRAEDVSPDFAGNSARVDFFLPRDRIVVEVKMMRESLTQKKVANELIEDIARYSSKDGVDTLICLVYDPNGRCQTPQALESDLSKSATRLEVTVVVCPKGM